MPGTHHVSSVNISPVVEHQVTDVGVALLGCNVERSLVHLGPRIPATARSKKDLAGVHLAVLGRQVERGGTQPVRGEGGTTGHQQSHPLRVAVLRAGQELLAQLHQGTVVDSIAMLT